jgi:hypothetical protein
MTRRCTPALLAILAFTATAQTWTSTDTADKLRGTEGTEYSLPGTYLVPSRADQPILTLVCQSGKRGPKFDHGVIDTGTVLDSKPSKRIGILYRLDDDHGVKWDELTVGDSYKTLVFGDGFTRRLMRHKRAIISVNPFVGGEIQIEFEFPRSTEQVGRACGLQL